MFAIYAELYHEVSDSCADKFLLFAVLCLRIEIDIRGLLRTNTQTVSCRSTDVQ